MKSKGKSRTIYVHEEDYEYLRQIGGSYAEGLRRAVQAHRGAALILAKQTEPVAIRWSRLFYELMEKGNPHTPQLENEK